MQKKVQKGFRCSNYLLQVTQGTWSRATTRYPKITQVPQALDHLSPCSLVWQIFLPLWRLLFWREALALAMCPLFKGQTRAPWLSHYRCYQAAQQEERCTMSGPWALWQDSAEIRHSRKSATANLCWYFMASHRYLCGSRTITDQRQMLPALPETLRGNRAKVGLSPGVQWDHVAGWRVSIETASGLCRTPSARQLWPLPSLLMWLQRPCRAAWSAWQAQGWDV